VAEVLAVRSFDRRADIVVTNGPIGWGLRGKHRSVHYYHGTYVGQAEAIRPWIKRRGYAKMRYLDGMVLERLAGQGKACVTCSDLVSREVKRWFGYDAPPVYHVVDCAVFRPGPPDSDVRERLGVTRAKPVGLFVGVGRPVKNEHAAFQVAETTAHVIEWVAVGEHPVITPPKGLRIMPRVPPEVMPKLLRSVDLVLAPSRYDSFSFLVAETLACGTPVISTRQTGSATLLMGEGVLGSWLVDSDDVKSMSQAALRIAADPGAARAVAMEGRARVEATLTFEAWASRFVDATGIEAIC